MSTREIILDTETTGLDPRSGHRIVEVACLEIENRKPTGKTFHHYINPERDVPIEAARVHGLTSDFLKKHDVFSKISNELLSFIDKSPLIIHNAPFDMKFLKAEYQKLQLEAFTDHTIIDTLDMARKAYPRQGNSLDALCKRFSISLDNRDLHGALIDCELLAAVYFELTGGAQRTFSFGGGGEKKTESKRVENVKKEIRAVRPLTLSKTDQDFHHDLVGRLKNPLWDRYKVAS